MIYAILLFLLAGLAEIGGGYLIWLWLREDRPFLYGLVGGAILVLYGIIPTLQKSPSFGRVYAAYGGVFVILSVLWGILLSKGPFFFWFLNNSPKVLTYFFKAYIF